MAGTPKEADVTKAEIDHIETEKTDLKNGDEALDFLDGHAEDIGEEEAAAVLKKIDWYLMPVLIIVNCIQLVDKNTLGAAATYGLIDQAKLKGSQYSLLVTLFYIGYMVAEYPANYLMQKLPTGKFLTINFILWGVVLACTGAATSFPGLAAGRFLLGVFEAPINPGLVVITSSWWKTSEQARRVGIWYSATGGLTVAITMAFYGIAHIENTNMFPYQWVFIIFGLLTAVIGISLCWVLPDSPTTCRFLNERERIVAIQRVKDNNTGIKNKEHKRYQIWEALKDVKVWLLTAGVFFQNMTNTLQNSFNGLIIKGLGFNTHQAVLLTLPVGIVFLVSCLGVTWILGTRWGQGKRCFAAMLMYVPGVISTVILYAVPVQKSTIGVLLFALYFLNVISTCPSIMYSLLASNIAGYTKKSVVNSMFFVSYSLGNIISPQAFLQRESPRYTTGVAVTLASFCTNILVFGALYINYAMANRTRDKEAVDQPEMTEDEKLRQAFSDMTDKENRNMRYAT
ncbi:MFS general substrate transporter [Polyplosphaeria fusca]|uniref:MFS general substrate transporter n=1 Tax=Polyplosphaeria fusca TaxID=682080 RepID=A0A9P4QSM5_9PLEO|nr:MFS general substrate transporter [Polyplosphaeria fusca]